MVINYSHLLFRQRIMIYLVGRQVISGKIKRPYPKFMLLCAKIAEYCFVKLQRHDVIILFYIKNSKLLIT